MMKISRDNGFYILSIVFGGERSDDLAQESAVVEETAEAVARRRQPDGHVDGLDRNHIECNSLASLDPEPRVLHGGALEGAVGDRGQELCVGLRRDALHSLDEAFNLVNRRLRTDNPHRVIPGSGEQICEVSVGVGERRVCEVRTQKHCHP